MDEGRDSVRGFVGWYSLIWLNNDGSLDTTRIHRQSEGPIVRFKELPDGKFICNGSGGMVQGRNVSILFRVDSDGALDTTFNAPFLDYCYTYSYHPQSDGKVVCGGRYHFVGSPDTLSLIRLLPDGQLDPTFNNHLAFRSTYHHLATPSVLGIQPIGPDKLAITGALIKLTVKPAEALPWWIPPGTCWMAISTATVAVPTRMDFNNTLTSSSWALPRPWMAATTSMGLTMVMMMALPTILHSV
ncbi:MAG: delta-60 repeat domain-containing protein [Flavobacteriales bacterium]|nr:delta-60 repeat domain-containing protein [Flavobacteriales bacterium]